MGLELARAYVTVRVDGGQVGPGLRQASSGISDSIRGAVSNAQNNIENFNQNVHSMGMEAMQSIERAALGIIGSVAAMAGNLLRKGFGLAAATEEDIMAFEVLLGSASETKKLFAELTEFAVKTPFEMPEIISATRSMVTFGERGEEVMRSLEFLGNTASGTKTKFGELARIYNQVRGVGRLMREDFYQLASRGIISMPELAQYFKVTTEEVNKMMSDGKISFEDFKKVLQSFSAEGGKFENMMEKQSRTFNGLMSTFRDAINMTYKAISEKLLEPVKLVVRVMIMAANSMEALARNTGNLIPYTLAATVGVSGLTTAVLALRTAMSYLNITMRAIMIGTGIGAVLILASTAAAVLVVYLEKVVKNLMTLEVYKERLFFITQRLRMSWVMLRAAGERLFAGLANMLKDVLSTFEDLLGIQFDTFPLTVEDALVRAIEYVSVFVLEVSSWTAVMVQEWRLVWDNMREIVGVSFSAMLDIASNFDRLAYQILGYSLNRMFWLIVSFSKRVLLAQLEMVKGIADIIMALPDLVAAGVSGADSDGILVGLLKGPLANIAALGEGLMGEFPSFDELFKLSDKTLARLNDAEGVMKKLNDLREEMKRKALGDLFAEDDKKGKVKFKKPGEKEADKKDSTGLGPGVIGFLEVGKKLQEKLLGKGGDKQDQMINLLDKGNKIQEEQLDMNKKANAANEINKDQKESKEEEKKLVSLMIEGNAKTDKLIGAISNLKVGGMLT